MLVVVATLWSAFLLYVGLGEKHLLSYSRAHLKVGQTPPMIFEVFSNVAFILYLRLHTF